MKLFYFSESNLRRTPFIKQFVSEINQFKDKAILLHAPFGSAADTRFVTKRLSSLLSEVLVVNMGLNGDQRGLIERDGKALKVNAAALEEKFQTLQLVVLNPLLAGTEGEIADPLAVATALREVLPIDGTWTFLNNSRSPLAAEKHAVEAPGQVAEWLKIYDEEADALQAAATLAPATLVSAANFAR